MGGTKRRPYPLRYYTVTTSANGTQWDRACAERIKQRRGFVSGGRWKRLQLLYNECNGHRADVIADWESLQRTLEQVVRDANHLHRKPALHQ